VQAAIALARLWPWWSWRQERVTPTRPLPTPLTLTKALKGTAACSVMCSSRCCVVADVWDSMN